MELGEILIRSASSKGHTVFLNSVGIEYLARLVCLVASFLQPHTEISAISPLAYEFRVLSCLTR